MNLGRTITNSQCYISNSYVYLTANIKAPQQMRFSNSVAAIVIKWDFVLQMRRTKYFLRLSECDQEMPQSHTNSKMTRRRQLNESNWLSYPSRDDCKTREKH